MYSNVQNEQFPRRHFYVPFGEFVHLHMQYYSFSNTILKCAAFQFFTPAGKPTVNFYLHLKWFRQFGYLLCFLF